MNSLLAKLFRYRDKKSPDVLGLYPQAVHIPSMPERRYLWTARILVICGVFSICVTMMLALTIYLLLPQRGARPAFYRVEENEYRLVKVPPMEVRRNTLSLVTESLIARYVKLRHEVPESYAGLMYRWDRNSEFFQISSTGAYSKFIHKMDDEAIRKLILQNVSRKIEIDDITQLTRNLWSIRFRTITTSDDAPKPQTLYWRAHIRVGYFTFKKDPKQQEGENNLEDMKNPFGFQVINYSVGYVGSTKASDHYLDVAKQVFELENTENRY